MAWVKLDDSFIDHPKIACLSDKALRLHLAGLCYTARYLTDGFLPESFTKPSPKKIVGELVPGLWEPVYGGYMIHDYLDYNISRDQWTELRAKKAAAGALGGKQTQRGRLSEVKAEYIASVQAPA